MKSIAMLSLLSPMLLLAACGKPAPEPEQTTDAAAAPAPTVPAAASPAAPAAPAAGPSAEVDFASLTGDATRGQTVFMQCRSCHSNEAGKNGVGPSLHGVIGRVSGSVAGYAYSDGNKKGHINWTPETLFTYLARPAAMVPGTKMGFMLPDAQKRADVIAYLETLK